MKKQDIQPYNTSETQRNYEHEEAYLRAKKRVEKITGFYWHLLWYVVINIFIIIMIARSLDANQDFWSFNVFSTAFFWGIGLFFHGAGVFAKNILFGKNWEKRQIEKYIEKEKQHWE